MNITDEKYNKKYQNKWETIKSMKDIIFNLDKDNVVQAANTIFNEFYEEHQLSFLFVVSQIIYSIFIIRLTDFDIYLNFLKEIDKLEVDKKSKLRIIDIFANFLIHKFTHEAFYLLKKMIEYDFIETNIVKKIETFYFIHLSEKSIDEIYSINFFDEIENNLDNLKKNDWELHKKLIEEGVNPNKIAKIIQNDEIEKLQEISSQPNFDFDQKIEPSLYERCSFINKENVALIDYAAFFSAVKCFKYLLMNNANVENTGKYAVAGGNDEIIHLCEQNHSSFEGAYEVAIKYHKNNIFKYIFENKINNIDDLEKFGVKCLLHHNYELFTFLLGEGMKISNSIINELAKIGNIFLVKYFLKENQLPEDLLVFSSKSGNIELVKYILDQEGIDINAKDCIGETALIGASEKGHTEIVKLLLMQKNIDINAKNCIGKTALMYASENDYTEIVKLLLKQEGIDINAKDNFGNTALIGASDKGHIEIVKLLLEQEGIDISAKDIGGYTALMSASYKGHIEIVKLLMNAKNFSL